MTKILVILGHPRRESLCGALAGAYQHGAEIAGHEVRRIDVGALPIDPVLRTGFTPHAPEEPEVAAARDSISWAEHLCFVWPLWFGDMPAILKGFLERTLTMGFAARQTEEPPFYEPLLIGRTARVIVTMQMPTLVYRFVYRAHATRILHHQILGFVGIDPVDETIFGGVDDQSPETRAEWLAEVRRLGANGR